ncbi:phage baseplate assembly protein [Acetobacter orientalis]|uniref:phage baseplate assembly protein n=1 Tax=Acetobacter orientalis TaxID=146474 RepID=UPI0039E9D176
MSIFDNASQVLGYSNKASPGVTIIVGSYKITGWQRVSVRMGIEIMPWTAMLETSLWQPDMPNGAANTNLKIKEGDECYVILGSETVLTGYVQTITEEIEPENHILRVVIVSKSVDLVECSALFSTYQMNQTTVLGIAEQVCKESGVFVWSAGNAGNTKIQQFSVILTETAYEVIERATRLAGCLFYDQPNGTILLSPLGTEHVGTLTVGKSIERLTIMRSQVGRFSKIQAIIQNMAVLFSPPEDGDRQAQQMQAQTAPVQASATDSGVKRSRTLLIPVENGDADYAVARQRVQWEVARRYGRSQVVEVTCGTWLNCHNKLLQPNTLVTVSNPKSGWKRDYLIAEIEFTQGEQGTRANLILMPPEAFKPEPLIVPIAQNEGVAAATRNR